MVHTTDDGAPQKCPTTHGAGRQYHVFGHGIDLSPSTFDAVDLMPGRLISNTPVVGSSSVCVPKMPLAAPGKIVGAGTSVREARETD